MAKSSLPVMRDLLIEAGYCVLLRTSGWAECFVQRDAERWEGRGQTADEALDDALGKMFPSHFAQALLDRAAGGRPEAPAHPAQEPGFTAAYAPIAAALVEPTIGPPGAHPPPNPAVELLPTAIAVTMGGAEGPPQTPLVAITMGGAEGPPQTPLIAMVDEGGAQTPLIAMVDEGGAQTPLIAMVDEGGAAPDVAVEPVPPTALPPVDVEEQVAAPPPALAPIEAAVEPRLILAANEATQEKPARVRTADALETVERLLASIEDRLGPLARMCADRQRLHMMVWICRARAVEEAHPGAREVEHAVARVARRLTEIGKMFWPGSVRALQLSARPADVRREMHASWASEPANWHEATALAERLLEEHLLKSPEAGLDEDGWADGALRTPRPADPDALFEEVDAELKAMLAPPDEVPNGRMSELGAPEFDQLLQAVRKLRWVRGAVRNDLAWGVALGRVRRAVPSLGERSGRVRDVLDHRNKPPVPWAKLLGDLTPEPATPPGESPADLAAALPAAIVTKESLLAWLIRAFDVINTPDLVRLLAPIKDYVVFDEETLNHPDRRVRRRLRELVKRVASADDVPVVKEAPRDVEETSDEPLAAHALDALAAHVRAHTQGRKALFVSNREDPELGQRLRDLLGIEITWCDGSLRRVQAMCERIKGGSTYNLVLSATGFQVHGVDSALARASSTAHIPYVRVNRGRPMACVQAIAREFGLLQSGTFNMLPMAKAAH